jgi:hypothetical protein
MGRWRHHSQPRPPKCVVRAKLFILCENRSGAFRKQLEHFAYNKHIKSWGDRAAGLRFNLIIVCTVITGIGAAAAIAYQTRVPN